MGSFGSFFIFSPYSRLTTVFRIFHPSLARRGLKLWLRPSPSLASPSGSYVQMVFRLFPFRCFSFCFLSVAPTIVDLLLPGILLSTCAAFIASTATNLHACNRKLQLCSTSLMHAGPCRARLLHAAAFWNSFLWPRAAPLASPTIDPSDQLVRFPPKVARVLHAPPPMVLSPHQRLGLDSNCYPMLPLSLNCDLAREIMDIFKNHLKTTSDSVSTISTTSNRGLTTSGVVQFRLSIRR